MADVLNPHLSALLSHIQCTRATLTQMRQQDGQPDAPALLALQQQLHNIEAHKHDGIWCGNLRKGQIPEGQAEVQETFQQAMDMVEVLQKVQMHTRTPNYPGAHIQCSDTGIHGALFLYVLYFCLHQRSSGDATSSSIVSSHGPPSSSSQVSGSSVLHAKEQLDSFMASVTASVQAVLTELQREAAAEGGGVMSADGVSAYQHHLRVIEQHKHNGVWGGNLRKGMVPEGQAALNQLFEETSALADKLAQKFK